MFGHRSVWILWFVEVSNASQYCGDKNLETISSEDSFNITSLACEEIVMFLKVHSDNIVAKSLIGNASSTTLIAFTHLVGTLLTIRNECVTESLRFVSFLLIQDCLTLAPDDGIRAIEKFKHNLDQLPLGEAPSAYYSHEYDGRLSTLEAMRIRTFHEQETSLKCLLRYSIRDLFEVGDTILDLGSGPEAVHSVWLNKTGLVTSYAVDGFPNAHLLTQGLIHEADIANYENILQLLKDVPQTDWVWIVNVLETVIESNSAKILRNIVSVIKPSKGVIITFFNHSLPVGFDPYVLNASATTAVNTACNVTEGFYILNFT